MCKCYLLDCEFRFWFPSQECKNKKRDPLSVLFTTESLESKEQCLAHSTCPINIKLMKNVLLIFISQYIVVVAGTKQELNTCMLKTKP